MSRKKHGHRMEHHINSDFLNGMNKEDAIDTMIQWLTDHHCGEKKVNYRLREWIFARQRYWGEPIPVINFDDGTSVALSDDELPLTFTTTRRLLTF